MKQLQVVRIKKITKAFRPVPDPELDIQLDFPAGIGDAGVDLNYPSSGGSYYVFFRISDIDKIEKELLDAGHSVQFVKEDGNLITKEEFKIPKKYVEIEGYIISLKKIQQVLLQDSKIIVVFPGEKITLKYNKEFLKIISKHPSFFCTEETTGVFAVNENFTYLKDTPLRHTLRRYLEIANINQE